MHRWYGWTGLAFVCLTVTAVGSVRGQTAAAVASPDTTRISAAHRALEAAGAGDAVVNTMKASLPSQRAVHPEIPAEFWTRFESRMTTKVPELIDSMAVVYAQEFSVTELNDMTAFYHSPSGKHFRDRQGFLTQQGYDIGLRWGTRIGGQIGAELQAEAAKKPSGTAQ